MIKIVENYLKAKIAAHYSPCTIADYSNTFKKAWAFWGDERDLIDITTDDLRDFFASQTQVSRKTVMNYWTAFSSIFTWAIDEGLMSTNPVRKIKIRKPVYMDVITFNKTEIVLLLNAAGEGKHPERDITVLLFLLDTGVRATELCTMAFKNLDLPGRKITVIGKGDKPRVIRFSNRTAFQLQEYIRVCKHDLLSPLFITEDGEAFSRDTLRLLLDRLSLRSGVTAVHAHKFRHTFATEFLRNSGNIYVLQRLLGHTTLDMVKRYLSIVQNDLDSAMDKSSPVEGWKL